MALTYNQVSAITHRLINESLADAIYGSNPLFFHLKERGQVRARGGRKINLPLIYAKGTANGYFQGYETLDTTPTDTITSAEADWVQFYSHLSISNRDLALAAGESGVVDLLAAKVKGVEMDLFDTLGTGMFSANADVLTSINGLRSIVKATGTLHGIAPADFSAWVSDVDAVTSSLSLSKLNQAYLDATVGGEQPDLAVCHKAVYANLWDLLVANQRFGDKGEAKGGFKYLMFNEVPVFFDSHCPGSGAAATADNHLFFLNSKWLYFYMHKDWNFKRVEIGPLHNQSVYMERIEGMGNLLTDNRRMHSAMTKLKA